MWETVVWEKPDDGSNDESVEEEEPLSEEEEKMLDNGDYESFLQGLSDEEIDELMQSLEEEVHELGGEEPEKEGNEAAATVRHEEL